MMKFANRAASMLPIVAIVGLVLLSSDALASTVDTTFDTVVTQLSNWATGGLGRVIALSAVIVGAIISVVRSNPLPILSGIAFAMILNFAPQIITGVLSATI